MNRFLPCVTAVLAMTFSTALTQTAAAQTEGPFSKEQQMEMARLDCATMLGKADSWIRGEKEAAIELFLQKDQLLSFVEQKILQYDGKESGEKYFDQRIKDRVAQLKASLKNWNGTVPLYLEKQPVQIASELKSQRRAVERYKKSKNPRPGSFAYIPKTVWETKDKLQVLTATGHDTTELQEEQQAVEQLVMELVATMDSAELAKKNNTPRDGYKQEDRADIEAFIKEEWQKTSDEPIVRIVMPKQSWSNTYGLSFPEADAAPEVHEVDRITVYVATRKTDDILTLHPFRMMRLHYKVHGKLLDRAEPESPQRIPTNEFAVDVLEKNIR